MAQECVFDLWSTSLTLNNINFDLGIELSKHYDEVSTLMHYLFIIIKVRTITVNLQLTYYYVCQKLIFPALVGQDNWICLFKCTCTYNIKYMYMHDIKRCTIDNNDQASRNLTVKMTNKIMASPRCQAKTTENIAHVKRQYNM